MKLNEALIGEVFEYALNKTGIGFIKGVPEYVEVVKRGDVTFVINHLSEEVNLNLGIKGSSIIGTVENGVVRLKPYGVCIVRDE